MNNFNVSMMTHLRDSLEGIIDSSNEDTSEYRIAYFLLESCYIEKSVSIQDVADKCFVSKATVSRFCRSLGYNDYQELNEALMQAFMRDSLEKKFDHYSPSSFIEQYFQELNRLLSNARNIIRQEDVERIAKDIFSYKRVGLLGKLQSNSIAIDLQHDLLASHKVSTAPIIPSDQLSFIQNSDEDTYLLVISCSGTYLKNFISFTEFQPKRRPKICLLTNNRNIKNRQAYDDIVILPDLNPNLNPLQLKLFCNLIALSYSKLIEKID